MLMTNRFKHNFSNAMRHSSPGAFYGYLVDRSHVLAYPSPLRTNYEMVVDPYPR